MAFLQAWARISTRNDREQIQQVARAGLEPGTTQPRFLLSYLDSNGPTMLVLAPRCIVRVLSSFSRAFIDYVPLYVHAVVIGSCLSLLRFEGTLH